jgi:hypothetical protein
MMSNKPMPPVLKIKKITTTVALSPKIKELLEEASRATGLSQSAYIERSLATQFKLDHID